MNENAIGEVFDAMLAFDAGDARRIQHFMKVHAFAKRIGEKEGLPEHAQRVLEAAALVHDIGIHAAEQKYQSTAGPLQEKEGAPLAKEMLEKLGWPQEDAARVSYLVGHHHTYRDVDGKDYQILLEADFLVNAYEDAMKTPQIHAFGEKVFRTASGKEMLQTMFG